MLIARVRWLELALPFLSSRIALLLSWNMMFLLTLYPCALINNLVHSTILIESSAPTSSASVELQVLSFCFLEINKGAPPLPSIFRTAPVWLQKSGCTAKDASTCYLAMFMVSAPRIKHSSLVPLRYFISRVSLFQSVWFGCFTRVHRNTIVGRISGLALFDRKRSLATIQWNSSLCCPSRFLLSSMLNSLCRWSFFLL